jgi:acetylornithine deacetylase/succinyl-diaminopimelate desuccinylase-like protein
MIDCERYLEANNQRFVDELIALLRFPSLSADPARSADMIAAANWVSNRMARAGVENIQLLPPANQPAIYGDWLHAPPGSPTVLIYGHYDVQPADPIELWTSSPFDPTVRDGRIYARGASDMKGNLLLPLIALEALLESGLQPSANLKFLFEGQEEIGSPDLARVIESRRELFACDLVVSADGGQLGPELPSLWQSVRGLCAMQIDITGPSHDLHSGIYGGGVQNPLNALTELLATLHAPDGHVKVAGFYDDVAPVSHDERHRLAAIPLTEDQIRQSTGLAELFGEPGYSFFERTTLRPTIDINGIWGGYTGVGQKTVIAREGHAKISCRLVANQDPHKVASQVEKHLLSHAPAAVNVSVNVFAAMAAPYSIPSDHPGNLLAESVLRDLYGKEPIHARSGGTIPIFGPLKALLGADCVTLGFGLEDEAIHSPNEFFRLSSFRRGQEAYVALLQRLGELRLTTRE